MYTKNQLVSILIQNFDKMKGNLNIEFVKKINELAVSKTKFFVVIDFEKKKPLIFQEILELVKLFLHLRKKVLTIK